MKKIKNISRDVNLPILGSLDNELEQKWNELANVKFYEGKNGERYLSENWYIFPKDTYDEIIWNYFHINHSKGIIYLLDDFDSKSISLKNNTERKTISNDKQNLFIDTILTLRNYKNALRKKNIYQCRKIRIKNSKLKIILKQNIM